MEERGERGCALHEGNIDDWVMDCIRGMNNADALPFLYAKAAAPKAKKAPTKKVSWDLGALIALVPGLTPSIALRHGITLIDPPSSQTAAPKKK